MNNKKNIYNINNTLYSYTPEKIGLINIGYNLVYLNYLDSGIITIPIKINNFYIHLITETTNYSSILETLATGKVNIKKLQEKGTFLFDLEFNILNYNNLKGEDFKDYLHPYKKKELFLSDLFIFLSYLKNKNFDLNNYKIVLNSKNYNFFDNNFLKENINLFIFSKNEININGDVFKKILENSHEYFKKILSLKQKNLFSTIKEKKEKRRKKDKEILKLLDKKILLLNNERYKLILEKYGKEKVQKRIAKEIQIIIKEGFSEYFLNFYKITSLLDFYQIPFHLKGSGAGSLLLYLMYINNLNPLDFNLSFNRFLGHGKVADIDIDVPGTLRENILQKLKKAFKKEDKNIYYIINKSAINFDKLTLHPTGILIEDSNIIKEIPLIKDTTKKIEISQLFDSGSEPTLEKLGYLKYDLISSKILEYIHLKLVKNKIQPSIFLNKWDTYIEWSESFYNELLNSEYEYFQLSSSWVKKLFKEYYKPTKLEDLAKVVAINRPSILRNYNINEIANSINNRNHIDFNDTIINRIVQDSETGSLMVYQDQILNLLLYILPDIPYKEITNLIKGRSSRIEEYKKIFFERLLLKKVTKKNSHILWKNIEAFKDYGMNKSHSYSYAFITLLELYVNKNLK